MLQRLLGRWSLILVFGEKLHDKVLCFIRHVAPYRILERELTQLDLLHYLLVRSSVEWRNTREHDVRNNTAGPDVALGAVVLGQDLGRDIVWRTQLLIELLVLIIDQ